MRKRAASALLFTRATILLYLRAMVVRQEAIDVSAEASEEVCSLALDVLSRQAEGRLLFAARDYVQVRAKEHGVERDDAKLSSGNVLDILERGPESDAERDLIAALMVRGLKGKLDDEERVARFEKHATWLELATPYSVYPFVRAVLDDAKQVWRAVANAVEDDDAALAENAIRVRALSDADDAAWSSLTVSAPGTLALVRTFGPGDASSGAGASASAIEGQVTSAPPSGFLGALRLFSGFALLQWIVRLLGRLVGYRREATLSLVDEGVHVKTETRLLTKRVRESEETFAWAGVASIARRERYPALHLLVGALALALGIVVGGLFLFDGIRTGETVLLLIGAGIVLAGGAFDLLLSVIIPGRKGTVALDVRALPKHALRVSGIPRKNADEFARNARRKLR